MVQVHHTLEHRERFLRNLGARIQDLGQFGIGDEEVLAAVNSNEGYLLRHLDAVVYAFVQEHQRQGCHGR